MAFNFEILSSGSNASVDSLVLPFTALDGLSAGSELGNSANEDDAKIAHSIFSAIQTAIASISNPLGVSQTRPNPTGAGTNLINQNLSITWNYVVDLTECFNGVYPSDNPTREVALTDVFAGSEILDAGGSGAPSASADGIAIPMSELVAINEDVTLANKQGSLGNDQRDMLEALTRWVHQAVEARAAGVESAVVAKTRSNANGSAPPANFFADTTYSEANAPNLAFFGITYALTFQYLLNPDTGTYEENVA